MIAGSATERTSSGSASSYLTGKECRSFTGSAVKFRRIATVRVSPDKLPN